ncbi:MAG: GNAT family N-acetyltransferase [Clostridia bacterium]|nr:GNAT family N-acetyltransferase [Clostridia bacterium]
MSIIRAMTNEDLLAYKHLCSICYTYTDTSAPEVLSEEALRQRMGVFGEDGMLHSAMMQIPYTARFEGADVKLLGIGGVVTDPTSRGQRGIRRLFEEGLPRLCQEGYVFSALYPFSHCFYRKFGYEWAEFWRNAEISRQSLRSDLCGADEIVRVLPGEDDQGMNAVYEQYIADKDLALHRSEWMWNDLRRGTPWDSLKHAYVLRIADKPAAYWIGRMDKQGYSCTLTIQDMAWTCQQGLEAIFAMLRGMNELETIRVKAQSGFEPRNLTREPYDVEEKGSCTGMVRVMNVERALAMLPAPPLPGTVTIAVRDEQIAQNCGSFTVRCDGYAITVEKDDRAEPDLRCGINGLSALVVGRERLGDAINAGMAEVKRNKNLRFAELLFAQRRLHMNENF